ncbi:hypothetical protein [uncultured Clostridium sp.]|uniref:hypothetical protein n=1 Tax=uncultured Clostridium sp. TaxID=59620 RepID=UPI0025FBD9C8|nr:hypothetical protein [uncultured Clostridium sp.]
MSKKNENCYWCGKEATSREHVPPKCLFPEDKDIKVVLDKSFRKDLITVPSCDEHNLSKSNDDEYLMACMAAVVGNNDIAYIHTRTKVSRSVRRNPNLFKIIREGNINIKNYNYPVAIAEVNTYRLSYSFEAIARAMYYYECTEQFKGKCSVWIPFFRKEMNDISKQMLNLLQNEINQERDKWIVKGENQDIFKYQLGNKDRFGSRILVLNFYNNLEVYIAFSSVEACKYFNIKVN